VEREKWLGSKQQVGSGRQCKRVREGGRKGEPRSEREWEWEWGWEWEIGSGRGWGNLRGRDKHEVEEAEKRLRETEQCVN
jgi:hypothetical protein